ncbi:DUF4870 family protein [Sneathiella chinensis]|uniref:Membrane protein n=1 Tax=Sneathiella chinensis TaxID=349750 RepID=A0ABQ5U0S1_9PROT|nr:hypothetical protein [Sneathiella chinensis]GLQ05745.1 membrane protein [Sneathiella chinensis]
MAGDITEKVVEQSREAGAAKMSKIIYILYLVGAIFGLAAIVGVIMAYVNRGDATEWVKTHYRFQIRTFWIGFLFYMIAGVTMAIGIGFLLWIATIVWMIIRCVKGMKFLDRKEGYPQPASWLW